MFGYVLLIMSSLAMRLSHHKRPEFVPPKGVTLKDVQEALEHLEKVEQERSLALHAELNRQIKLAMLADQHKSIYDNLVLWFKEKEAYLRKKELVESVLILNILILSCTGECRSIPAPSIGSLR